MSSGGPHSQVRPPGAVRFGLTPRFDSFQHRRAVRLANRSNTNDNRQTIIDMRSTTGIYSAPSSYDNMYDTQFSDSLSLVLYMTPD